MVNAKACRTGIGLFLVLVLLATWETMSIVLKGMETTYHQSFFISYVCRTSYIVCIPIWWILKTATGRKHDALPRWPGHLFVFLMSFIGIWGIFAWYVSLEMTDIAFNNAIYQTTAVFVYLLSIPLLKMKVSAYGISALVLALGGLALVTFFSPSSDTPAKCSYVNATSWAPEDMALANMTVSNMNSSQECCAFCKTYSENLTTTCESWVFDAVTSLCRVSDRNFTEVNAASTMTAGRLTPSQAQSTALGYILCLVSVVVYAFFEVFYKMYEHLLAAPKANEHSLLVSSATTTGVDVETVALHGTDKLGQSLDEDASDDKQDGAAGAASANSTSKKDLEQDSELDLLTSVLDCLKFLGLMGLYTGITVAPCVYILDVAKVEVFVDPFTPCGGGISCFSYMIIDGVLDMTYNVCLLLGISLTSPRFMSAGTIMIIPVGVVVDIIQYPHMVWNAWAILGAAIIIMSFLVMEFLESIVKSISSRCSGTRKNASADYERVSA